MRQHTLGYLLVVVLLVYAAFDSVFTVDQRTCALLFEFGKISSASLSPGVHFKLPFVQTVRKFDARAGTLDNQSENITTADKKDIVVGYYAKWKVANAATFWLAANGQSLNASDRLSSSLSSALRNELGAKNLSEIVSDDHAGIATDLQNAVQDAAKGLGVEVLDVRIKDVSLLDKINDAVYDRMRAEQASIAADVRAKGAEQAEKLKAEADSQVQVSLADAYRDAEKIRGEGDAKAAQIYAAAYGQDPEFYRFYRSMNAYRDAFHSKQDVLVLQPNSDFFRYFSAPGNGGAPKK
jgi:membrane protease subunit HflC